MPEQPDYHSYLIRLYRQKNDPVAWRVSLENVQTGERQGFASLQALFEHLSQVTQRLPVADNHMPAAERDSTEDGEQEFSGEET